MTSILYSNIVGLAHTYRCQIIPLHMYQSQFQTRKNIKCDFTQAERSASQGGRCDSLSELRSSASSFANIHTFQDYTSNISITAGWKAEQIITGKCCKPTLIGHESPVINNRAEPHEQPVYSETTYHHCTQSDACQMGNAAIYEQSCQIR